MIRRLLRPGTVAAELTASSPVAVLASGAGFNGWGAGHPTSRLLFDFVPVIYSLVLPYHGPLSSNPYQRTREEVVVSTEAVRALLSPLVASRYVLYLGYSMGSLYLLKLLAVLPSHPRSLLIAVGSALTLSAPAAAVIESWWLQHARDDAVRLTRSHGASYPTMIRFIVDTVARVDSALFSTEEEREDAVRKREVYWVTGDADLCFPAGELKAAVETAEGQEGDERQRVWEVASTHFAYFSPGTWPVVEAAVREIIARHARRDLLQPHPPQPFPSAL